MADFSTFTDPDKVLARSGETIKQIGGAQNIFLNAAQNDRAERGMSLSQRQFDLQQKDFENKIVQQEILNQRADGYLDLQRDYQANALKNSQIEREFGKRKLARFDADEKDKLYDADVIERFQQDLNRTPVEVLVDDPGTFRNKYYGMARTDAARAQIDGMIVAKKTGMIAKQAEMLKLSKAESDIRAFSLYNDQTGTLPETPEDQDIARAFYRDKRQKEAARQAAIEAGANKVIGGSTPGSVSFDDKTGRVSRLEINPATSNSAVNRLNEVDRASMMGEIRAVENDALLSPDEKQSRISQINRKWNQKLGADVDELTVEEEVAEGFRNQGMAPVARAVENQGLSGQSIRVVSPNGKVGMMPRDKFDQAKKAGFKLAN